MADLEKQLLFNAGEDWVVADVDGYEGEEALCLEFGLGEPYRVGVSPLMEVGVSELAVPLLRKCRADAVEYGWEEIEFSLRLIMPVNDVSSLIGTLEGLEQHAGMPPWVRAQLVVLAPLMDG